MTTDCKVAVIGGGIVGCAVLYWLTRLGWTDAVLLERRELTSGSTWHAAGNTTYFGPYPAMTRLFAGSIKTYLDAQSESGQPIDFHQTGSLRLAATQTELDQFHRLEALYEDLGIPYGVRTPEEVAHLHPLIDTSAIFGAAHTPTDGHVDPTGATNALAKAARAKGATVERWRTVEDIRPDNGNWILETETGPVRAENVVVAASYWSKALLDPLGFDLPLYGTQHHEIITEDIPQLSKASKEVPAMRDSYASCNVRQEKNGVLIGIYETNPVFWHPEGAPKDFEEELLPPELDRLMPHLERVMERMPALQDAGLKDIRNGPFCFTPDGLPLLGPMPGHDNLWIASGFNVGIGTGGGSGEFLANWMTNGFPPFDLKTVHANRFGSGMPRETALASIRSVYARGYRLPSSI